MARNDVPPHGDPGMRERLLRGEAAALGELYDRFAPLVHGLAHRVLGDEQAADLVTREVFAHVWEHPDAYDPRRGPLRAWVAGLAHRFAVRRLRAIGGGGAGQSSPGHNETPRTSIAQTTLISKESGVFGIDPSPRPCLSPCPSGYRRSFAS